MGGSGSSGPKRGSTVTRAALAALVPVTALSACAADGPAEASAQDVVNVYNWADYIAPDVIPRFEAETGIHVNYDVYDSQEVLDVKLLAGSSGYDVVVDSAMKASHLAPIGVFAPLDTSKLPAHR